MRLPTSNKLFALFSRTRLIRYTYYSRYYIQISTSNYLESFMYIRIAKLKAVSLSRSLVNRYELPGRDAAFLCSVHVELPEPTLKTDKT
ncbi:hypothetical protein BACI_pBAslCI1400120 (plasmid) [Bacillus cereus biovar anthracis str. CI]|nr:hypothetical protein BACI_pBAslCI1400120 [Bacillus cereus biovar anthracis str. CI]